MLAARWWGARMRPRVWMRGPCQQFSCEGCPEPPFSYRFTCGVAWGPRHLFARLGVSHLNFHTVVVGVEPGALGGVASLGVNLGVGARPECGQESRDLRRGCGGPPYIQVVAGVDG